MPGIVRDIVAVMKRREFLLMAAGAPAAHAAIPNLKITRVRFYENSGTRPMTNQSFHIVTVETDQGITGIGEGGYKTGVEQCASLIIGENPTRIEHLWQMMYRHYFYPPGREKLHALGAIDLALWDIKGKVLGLPVYDMLGGLTREHVECYATSFPSKGAVKDTARACLEAGFRAFRTSVVDPGASGGAFQHKQAVRMTHEHCKQIREGVGKDGDWCIDYHTRLDFPDAVRLSTLIEDLEPFFCEDLVRSENPGVYKNLRAQVKVPIAVGEQFGDRWDINELIEQRLIDYNRVTIPNAGGITEYVKLAALCETHYVGQTPHFTGPVSTAALAHCNLAFSGPVLMELTGTGPQSQPHLPHYVEFRNGKLWPNPKPGLGVELDTRPLKLVAEVSERSRPIPLFRRPDGSITNW
jgi:L-alanine-DL-glutamate epimerase-like enolase superfamily enzyme